MKVQGGAAEELALNDERLPEKKVNRHVVVALNHLNKRRESLTEQIDRLTAERADLDDAIAALA